MTTTRVKKQINAKPTTAFSVFKPADLQQMCENEIKILGHCKLFTATLDGESVAIKRKATQKNISSASLDSLEENNDILEQYNNEVTILSTIDNRATNIIGFYGYGTYETTSFIYHCIVMPLMPNRDLMHYIAGKFPPTWEVRIRMMIELTNSVAYLHGNELVHDDIKSLNVLLTAKCHIRLADFETAVKVGTQKSSGCTYLWRAPELFDLNNLEADVTRAITFASDVFSTSIVCGEIATWSLPLYGKFEEAEFKAAIINNKPRINLLNDCPDKLAHLLQLGWMRDPEKRPTIFEQRQELKTLRRQL